MQGACQLQEAFVVCTNAHLAGLPALR